MTGFFRLANLCLLGIGTVYAQPAEVTFLGPRAAGDFSPRALAFTERVAYQYLIEEVYWRHRIWPNDNPSPKPTLDAIVSKEQLEKKVEDYLHKSQLVEDQRGSPITTSELQAEVDRMASHTKQPDLLRELFAALRNDPFVIAECIARPIVAEQLLACPTVVGGVSRALRNLPAANTAASTTSMSTYRLPEILDDCTDDAWTAITTVNAPQARGTIGRGVWTGSEMIIWGGSNGTGLNTGGKYDPSTDTWTATSTTNAPAGRGSHTLVWTGTEMIVWGGYISLVGPTNTGGRYNPITDTWAATSVTNAPVPRNSHTAVWIGNEMIVWGGRDNSAWFNSGGRYDPAADSWIPTSTLGAPERRWDHTAEWIGNEMIVWGGTNQTVTLNTGGKYNPATDTWAATSTANAPPGRVAHTSIWSGSEMIVWGGYDSTITDFNTGGRYNPVIDSWAATSINNAPSPRDYHTAVWTGREMIIWGGRINNAAR